jgi:DNA-binding MarR family transcriptional regulator
MGLILPWRRPGSTSGRLAAALVTFAVEDACSCFLRLAAAHGQLTMTQLADGVVCSRSGLIYQAALLERAGLITRGPSPDDERATLVTITDSGLALLDRFMRATSRSPAACCSTLCPTMTCTSSATS